MLGRVPSGWEQPALAKALHGTDKLVAGDEMPAAFSSRANAWQGWQSSCVQISSQPVCGLALCLQAAEGFHTSIYKFEGAVIH